jgi:hypothetical protein
MLSPFKTLHGKLRGSGHLEGRRRLKMRQGRKHAEEEEGKDNKAKKILRMIFIKRHSSINPKS